MFNRHYVLLPGTDIASTARKLDARAEMLRDMPHRVQLPGSGCGLYSLGMVMDYWHTVDPSNPTALVCDKDEALQRLEPHGARYSCEPSVDERLLDVAIAHGHTRDGCCWSAEHLADVATHFGYAARTVHGVSLADLQALLDGGHPALVIFDVSLESGDPVLHGGRSAHVGVATGYRTEPGGAAPRWITAKHPQAKSAATYVWPAELLVASMRNVQRTDKASARPLPAALLRHLVWIPQAGGGDEEGGGEEGGGGPQRGAFGAEAEAEAEAEAGSEAEAGARRGRRKGVGERGECGQLLVDPAISLADSVEAS